MPTIGSAETKLPIGSRPRFRNGDAVDEDGDEEAGAAADGVAGEHRLEEGLAEVGPQRRQRADELAPRSRDGGGRRTNGHAERRATIASQRIRMPDAEEHRHEDRGGAPSVRERSRRCDERRRDSRRSRARPGSQRAPARRRPASRARASPAIAAAASGDAEHERRAIRPPTRRWRRRRRGRRERRAASTARRRQPIASRHACAIAGDRQRQPPATSERQHARATSAAAMARCRPRAHAGRAPMRAGTTRSATPTMATSSAGERSSATTSAAQIWMVWP